MRTLFLVLALLLAAVAACGGGSAGGPAPAAAGRTSPGAGGGAPQLTEQACTVMGTGDVQSALGVQVNQLPMSSPPPGGGPGGTLVSGCTYSSATGAVAGASLYLFRDLPIDYFGTLPGYQTVPGIGDRAFLQAPMLIGRKGHTTFQITIVSTADRPTQEQRLETLGRTVAGRL